MFGTFFLGVVLAIFLTLGVVSGDAERGLLQPLVVRPVGTLDAARRAIPRRRRPSASPTCVVVYFCAVAIVGLSGHWWPDVLVWPAVELAFAVMIVIALSLLGSVVLTATANGIGVFMLFGAGLVAGLLSSVGHGLDSHAIKEASTIAAWALPFEALYQDALRMITQDETGVAGFLIQLGPFGGAYVHGWPIRIWAVCYLVLIGAAALLAFSRRNL